MKNITTILFLATLLSISSCQEDICDTISCLNNGTCLEGRCDCPDGYEGENCEIQLSAVKQLLDYVEYPDSDNLTISYQYTLDSLLHKRTVTRNATTISEKTYDMIGDTLFMTQVNSSSQEILREKYVLIEPNVVRRENYNWDGQQFNLTNIQITTLDTECWIKRVERQGDIIGVSNNIFESNCDYITEDVDMDGNISNTHGFFFNDKKDPTPNKWNYFTDYQLRTPIAIEIYYDEVNTPGFGSTTYSYEYNKYDYPISDIQTNINGSIQRRHYFYK